MKLDYLNPVIWLLIAGRFVGKILWKTPVWLLILASLLLVGFSVGYGVVLLF